MEAEESTTKEATQTEEVKKEEEEKKPIETTPKETLYVNNLNEKVKIEELKKALYTLFGQHGTILEIIACKSYSLRGQAWIVFDSTNEASIAMQKLNGEEFYDKPLRINFAKDKSDVILERQGIRVDKETRKAEKRKQREFEAEERAKKRRAMGYDMQHNPPNKLLLVQNIPNLDPKIAHEMLTALFGQYEGLKEIRMAPGRGVAFVEFENEVQSGRARDGLQNFKVAPEFPLSVSFAK